MTQNLRSRGACLFLPLCLLLFTQIIPVRCPIKWTYGEDTVHDRIAGGLSPPSVLELLGSSRAILGLFFLAPKPKQLQRQEKIQQNIATNNNNPGRGAGPTAPR